MTAACELSALRLGGWIVGRGAHHHPSGAIVRVRAGITATRPDGTTRHRLESLADAAAWARGLAGDEVGSPPAREVSRVGRGAPRLREGWTGARGIYRHANGRVESGHPSNRFLAVLTSGERDLFRHREDALLWVEGRGVFPAGHVRAERRGA